MQHRVLVIITLLNSNEQPISQSLTVVDFPDMDKADTCVKRINGKTAAHSVVAAIRL